MVLLAAVFIVVLVLTPMVWTGFKKHTAPAHALNVSEPAREETKQEIGSTTPIAEVSIGSETPNDPVSKRNCKRRARNTNHGRPRGRKRKAPRSTPPHKLKLA
jgi:hypothetical protein